MRGLQNTDDGSTAHPKIKVRVTVDNSAVLEKKILENQLDFALIEGTDHSDRIVFREFKKDELAVICGADSAYAGRDELSPKELPGLPFLLREKGSGTRELFDSTMLTHGIAIEPVWESVGTQAIIRRSPPALGLSVLPGRLVRPDLERRSIKRLTIKNVRSRRAFSLIDHKDKFLTRSAKEFIKLCGPDAV